MKTPDTIFLLEPNVYDPRFRGFIFTGASSLLGLEGLVDDFEVENGEYLDWKPRSLQSVWTPVKVTSPTPVNAFNDYPCLELSTPVFSRRAVDALGEMLTQNGELLPLITDVGEYYAYVCLTKLDALDLKKSRVLRPKEPNTTAFDIEYFAFKKTKVPKEAIFRVREHPGIYLVTDAFKARAEQAGLNGMRFIKVWPLPVGFDYGMDDAKRNKNSKAAKLAGEALILRLRLKKEKPTPSEKKNAKEIESSLRTLLKVNSLDEKYRGSIEVSEFEDGEIRVFCTCPNCEELAEFLADWFEQVPWDNDFDIVKRYGNLYDKKAKEKRVRIK